MGQQIWFLLRPFPFPWKTATVLLCSHVTFSLSTYNPGLSLSFFLWTYQSYWIRAPCLYSSLTFINSLKAPSLNTVILENHMNFGFNIWILERQVYINTLFYINIKYFPILFCHYFVKHIFWWADFNFEGTILCFSKNVTLSGSNLRNTCSLKIWENMYLHFLLETF